MVVQRNERHHSFLPSSMSTHILAGLQLAPRVRGGQPSLGVALHWRRPGPEFPSLAKEGPTGDVDGGPHLDAHRALGRSWREAKTGGAEDTLPTLSRRTNRAVRREVTGRWQLVLGPDFLRVTLISARQFRGRRVLRKCRRERETVRVAWSHWTVG